MTEVKKETETNGKKSLIKDAEMMTAEAAKAMAKKMVEDALSKERDRLKNRHIWPYSVDDYKAKTFLQSEDFIKKLMKYHITPDQASYLKNEHESCLAGDDMSKHNASKLWAYIRHNYKEDKNKK